MKTICVIVTLVIACSCNSNQVQNPLSFPPKVVETQGYVVPKDSVGEPQVFPAGKPQITLAGKPKVIPVATNVYTAGKPTVVLAGAFTVHRLGQDSFSLPKTFPAIGKSVLAGKPEVIVAKDEVAKDQNPYNFSSFGKIQGLVNAAVFSLLKDKKGNLWIGTYGGGVCRYDGATFSNFTEKEGLGSNTVVSILEDKNDNLWFGTLGGGVCKYDGKTFTLFTEKEGLGSNFVNCLLEDRNGNVWIGTADGGVTKYDPGERSTTVGHTPEVHQEPKPSFTRYTRKEGLSNNSIWNICEDRMGNLWFATGGSGVCKYNGTSFSLFNENDELSFGVVKTIVEDKAGSLWIGTWGSGAYKFDGKYITHFTVQEGLSHNNVKTILEDRNGSLWFGTEGGGLNLYDPGEGSIRPSTFTHFTVQEGLSNNIVDALLSDENGILWIGTNNNLNRYTGNLFTHLTDKQGVSGMIRCVMEGKDGSIWFGGSDGLSKYDGKFITHFTEKEGMSQDNVNTLFEDKNGNLWFGSFDGITKYDGKTFSHFLSGDVHSIQEDESGNLWVGIYGDGLVKYDGKSFTLYSTNAGLNSNWIWTVAKDKAGDFWFGTADKGVSKFKPSGSGSGFTHFTEVEENNTKSVYAILEDNEGRFWFGTGGRGVICYNPAADKYKVPGEYIGKSRFTYYTKTEGLTSDFVMGILEDKNNNLWFSTSNGISKLEKNYLQNLSDPRFDRKKESNNKKASLLFKNFDYADGFHGTSAFQNAICEDKHGTIWIGTNDRLTGLHTEAEIPDTIAPNMQLTGLALFNEYIPWQLLEKIQDTTIILDNGERMHDLRFAQVNKWYGVPQQLSLAYDNNQLTFRYVGITTHSPKKVRYQYMLEGLDKNWSMLTDHTEIAYNNLGPGSYTFKVKAMNSEGYWSKELNYLFTIRPPWWLSTWAYAFYIACFLAAVFVVHNYQKQRVIRKERERSKDKELEQAKEIEKAYTQLKATQAQLIQSEKMASLGELTAGIAHEIQNPLNFVNNFSETNTELIQEAKNELKSGKYDETFSLLSDIEENEHKVVHHGRRADSIVKSMLEHSRSSKGEKQLTDINTLTEEYLRLAYHGFRAKDKSFNASIKTYFDENIGKINILPQDIGRVLLNLFNNAFYAVHEQLKKLSAGYEPTVIVSTKKLQDKIEVRVQDNGMGIPQQAVDKIFQPFFTTKPTGEGTGLGLSLSYDIVKAHGGELKVESTEGEGAAFTILLPPF